MTFTASQFPALAKPAGKPPRKPRRPGTSGKSLEALILASPGAVLTHVGQAAKRIQGGKVVAVRGPVDFFGTLAPGGRAIAIDAKRCELVRRFPVGDLTHLPQHQRAELVRYGRAGAVAGLIVEAAARGQLYWCGWQWLEAPPPSLAWDELYYLGKSSEPVRWSDVVAANARRWVRTAPVIEGRPQ